MTGIRRMYKDGFLEFKQYTHGEYCWEKARNGVPENENCDRKIDTNDIRRDAGRIKIRRLLYKKLMN